MQEIIEAAGLTNPKTAQTPDGVVTVTRADGMTKVAFGPSKAVEPGQVDGDGYDWTAYYLDDPDNDRSWTTWGGDWAEDDSDMADVLKRYLRFPGE